MNKININWGCYGFKAYWFEADLKDNYKLIIPGYELFLRCKYCCTYNKCCVWLTDTITDVIYV